MATYYAQVTGNDTTGNGSASNPYAKPSKIHSVGSDADTGLIGRGEYTESSYITYNKAISFRGEDKLDTVLLSANSSRIFYINNSKERVISDLTLKNVLTAAGPAYLVQSAGASIDLSTTFRNVYFNNGRTAAIALGTGDYGITVESSIFDVNINTLTQVLDLPATAGNITFQNNTVNVESTANVAMNGVIRQGSAATAGIITIDGNTFNINRGVYILRLGAGGWASGSVIDNNTFNITSASYTRPALELGNFTTIAFCRNNIIDIAASTTTSTPIQIRSTVTTGPDCVWTVENNIVSTRNVDGYAIILGDEGGDILSKKDAFNGSSIKNNTIYTGNYFGVTLGSIHSIMTGGNKNMLIDGNTVYNGTYGIVMKGADAWTSGYVRKNKFINCKWGVYPKGQQDIRVMNNTFVGTNGNFAKGILPGDLGDGTYATGTKMKNNIFSISSGYAIFVETNCETGIELDYNCYHLTGTAKAAVINGVEYDTLEDLQAAGYETHGISGDPDLKEDYSIDSFSIAFEKGVPIKGVTDIIDTLGGNLITLAGAADFSLDTPYRKRVAVT